MGELKPPGKPFGISKWEVQDAWGKVKASKGAPGVDEVTLAEFEADLGNNLCKAWNRMSSGSCFPPPVKAVEIPKPHGSGTRIPGVPCVAGRIAQTVVAARLEKAVEPVFRPGSYGYRPGRPALDAVAACRKRCWKKDWVIDLDVEKFFDSVRWDLTVKAVAAHTDLPWVVLYAKRWLAAPLQLPDGTLAGTGPGNRAGVTGQPCAGEPVHALRVRYLADPELPGRPGRAVRRRRDRALRHRTPGP
jgi:retron-type reverse transcriptase